MTDPYNTLTLIAGTGTPLSFTPNGVEWENSDTVSQSVEDAVVPEPGSFLLMGLGITALALGRRRAVPAATATTTA